MSTNVAPISKSVDPLAEAIEDYLWAKRDEDLAKAGRLAAEERLVALVPPKEEGSMTVDAGGYKLTLTGSLSYKADSVDAVRAATAQWPAELIPLKTKVELDATGCKFIRANRPDLWVQLAKAVTVSPAKTAVKVSV